MINTERFLGYHKDEYGDLTINIEEARIVERIFTDYLSGKGVFTIAKELTAKGIPSVGGKKWHETTILNMLRNEKYKGDARLQKTYTTDDIMNRSFKNNGEVDSYYIEENHPPIISNEMWDKVQEELKGRAKVRGNIPGYTKGYQNRYSLTGMLYCSKCGYSLIRRTCNSKLSCRKIVWQCSNYIRNGKASCTGTRVDNEIVSDLNINEETIVMVDIVVYDALACNSVWINHCINNKITPVVHVKENNISSIKEEKSKINKSECKEEWRDSKRNCGVKAYEVNFEMDSVKESLRFVKFSKKTLDGYSK